MLVMDTFTRRTIGFGIAAANLDVPSVYRMFNRSIVRQAYDETSFLGITICCFAFDAG